MSKILGWLVIGALALYLLFQVYVQMQRPDTGSRVPDFQATLVDGSPFQLSDLHGHYVILSFWASWCGPCFPSNRRLAQLYKEYQEATFDKSAQLKVVSIALEKSSGRTGVGEERFGFGWPYQIVDEQPFVAFSSLARRFGVRSIPTKILIGPEGNVIFSSASIQEIELYLQVRLNRSS